MPKQLRKSYITERTLISLALVLVLFISPLTGYWAALDAPWFAPYIVWAIAIFISWLLQRSIAKFIPK